MTEKSMTYNELRRLAAASKGNGPRIAVLGDCSTQHLSTAVCGSCKALGLDAAVFDADYDQVRAMIDDPGSRLYSFMPDFAVIYLCSEKLAERFCMTEPGDGRERFADLVCAETVELWKRFSALRPDARIIHLGPAMPYDGITGSLGNTTPSSFTYQLRRLAALLCEAGAEPGNITYLDLEAVQSRMGRDVFYDPRLYYLAVMTVSDRALPTLSAEIAGVVAAYSGKVKKCIILDLDGTLWGGTLAEDGMGGIEIGELGTGRAFSALQLYLRELRRRGLLLAVCSKNDESAALAAIRRHPDMLLRESDFAAFRANYEDKATNILSIAEELGIGTDSMVFLDDNSFERELVRSLVPGISVPELPDDPAMRPDYLRTLGLFEPSSLSQEDSRRTEMYRAEADRRSEQAVAASYEDYLSSLGMRLAAESFNELSYRRVSQLTQRSNQFNLRTVRYTPEQITALAEDGDVLTLSFSLSDRHGDCGLVGVIIARREGDGELFLDTFLMSCRVLRRGVEECMMNTLFSEARELGVPAVNAEYLPTQKNGMVAELLPRFGFTRRGDRYTCRVCDYIPKKTYIEVN